MTVLTSLSIGKMLKSLDDLNSTNAKIRLYSEAVAYTEYDEIKSVYNEQGIIAGENWDMYTEAEYITVPADFIKAVFSLFTEEQLYDICICTDVLNEFEVTLSINGIMYSFIYHYDNDKPYEFTMTTIDSVLININGSHIRTDNLLDYENFIKDVYLKFSQLKFLSKAIAERE